MSHPEKALVVLSGGQDSTTCLYWAIDRFGVENISSITFDYGQRHKIELECAERIAARAGVPFKLVPINSFSAIGENALVDESRSLDEENDRGLPDSFVPGRNLVFLTLAASYAYTQGVQHLVTGVAQTDYSGYPDCRENTLQALERAISLGLDYPISLHTPLMFMSKAATVKLAEQLGALEALADSHTCYAGVRPPCGVCPSCVLRAKGFLEAGIPDPLVMACAEESKS